MPELRDRNCELRQARRRKPDDYPHYAKAMLDGEADRAVFICGSGVQCPVKIDGLDVKICED